MLTQITIITVVFNSTNDIEQTIRSVVNQRNIRQDLNIDYLVVDGSSTDGTINVIKRSEHHITKWTSEPDRGIYDAMNKGIALARESFILFLGAGDEVVSLPDESLFTDVNTVIFGDVLMGDSLFKSNLSKGLKAGNSLHHQALLIHKSIIPVDRFNLKYRTYADYDLNIRLLRQGMKFLRCDKMISKQLPDGLSSNTYALEMVDVIKNNFGFYWATRMLLRCLASQLKQIILTRSSRIRWNRI